MASDSFTGTNSTALRTHDSNWVVITGGYPDNAYILSNALAHSAAADPASYRYTGSNGNTSQATVKGGTDLTAVRLSVRMAAGTWGYSAHVTTASNINVWKNGSTIGNVTVSPSFNDSIDNVLRITASGTGGTVTISVFVNGAQQGSDVVDSSSPYTSGLSGFVFGGPNDVATIDDWSDGAAAVASLIFKPVVIRQAVNRAASY